MCSPFKWLSLGVRVRKMDLYRVWETGGRKSSSAMISKFNLSSWLDLVTEVEKIKSNPDQSNHLVLMTCIGNTLSHVSQAPAPHPTPGKYRNLLDIFSYFSLSSMWTAIFQLTFSYLTRLRTSHKLLISCKCLLFLLFTAVEQIWEDIKLRPSRKF